MKEISIILRDGKSIYARYYNNNHEHTLLYLHGGPGASCSSFQHCAYKLSKYMNVILIDERGVLRSDKIEEDESCTVDMLVDDCESVRDFFGVSKFIVLGHSFGGFIALRYATKYPNSVEKIIFENPSFDFTDSIKSIESKAIKILLNEGNDVLANILNKDINNSKNVREFMNSWSEVPENVRNKVYYLKKYEEYTEEQKKLLEVTVDSNERWEYSSIHFEKLMQDESVYKNIIGLISDLKCKSLLISGEFDPVFSKEYIKKYETNGINCKVVIVRSCGHFVHTDHCDEYVKIVSDFVKQY